MNAPFYVELLTHNEEVKSRHPFNDLPVSIGRAYDNDLIVDDRYIAAHHAIIERDATGAVIMRDTGSRNGLVHQGKRVKRAAIDGNSIIRLGHTNLRLRSADFQVEQEVADNTAYGWEGWPPALAGIAIITLLSLVSVWITDTDKFSAVRYLLATALIFSIVVVWCGCWSFANRVIGSHARFGRHLFIVASALLLMDVWDILSVTIAYAYSLEFLTRYGSLMMMAISAGMVFFHLMTINSHHPKRFASLCVILAFLGSGLILLNNYQRDGRLGDELYMSHLLPPAIRQSANQPVAQFIDDAGKLKAQVDADRLKPINNYSLLPMDGEDEAESGE
ncbi:MAG TPA: FHA domain-containing protein [Methylophilaceae bacterium]|nr:FHA domain-containing protein [Methylophilaceae bacterium]